MVTSPASLNRISGITSGMDIDGIVKKLMDAERIPLNKITGNRQKLLWKQESIRSTNLDLKTFADGIQSMRLQSSFGLFTSTSTDSTAVTGKGTPIGGDAVMQFSNITALATSASTVTSIVGGLDGNAATKINPAALLSTVGFANPIASATGSFTINALQKDGTYKSTAISYDKNVDSLNAVMSRINSSGAGVTAFYDSGSDKVIMSNNATGLGTSGVAMQLTDTTGTFLTSTLGLASANGTDAAFTMNGVATTRQSNTFTVNGNEYTLLKTTAAAVNVEIKRDVDGIVAKVKDFIDKYNTMLDKLNSKNSEPTFRNYQPLTDEQKTAMKPEDIAAWEKKAKSGLLTNDSTLIQSIYGFRNDAYATVAGLPTGTLNQLASIGITTDLYQSGGKLVLKDEAKLRTAITQTPDQVTRLFTNNNVTDPTQNGIAWKLYNRANTSIAKFSKIGGSGTAIYDNSTLSKSIRGLDGDISKFNLKLQAKESRYYAKFTAMETAMNRLQSQGSNLISKLGG